MKRRSRIALEALGPPLLGAAAIFSPLVVEAARAAILEGKFGGWTWEGVKFFWVVVFVAYLVAGLPSLFYTAIMEWRFHRGLDPRSWRAVALSTFLGLLSGLAISGVLSGLKWKPEVWAYYSGVGVAVGFLLGWLIKVWSAKGMGR
ncbi:MAG: hypothetical protein HY302_13690 [Opitutae bacterium]|nr:hypothetical protein [Opitutae bacterium]